MIKMEERKKILKEYFDSIQDKDVKNFMEECIKIIPDYWFHVSASSSNKYHPDYAIGEGGLMRHTIALLRFFNRLVRNDIYGKPFTEREKDLLRVACLMHDSCKSGSQEDYEKNKYTKHEHPLLAAEIIRSINTDYITNEEKELIANAIESHMGQWNTNTRSKVVLPLPKNKYQKIVHLCDYLAAQKDIEVQFEGFTPEPRIITESKPTVENYIFPFGKYKGMKLIEVKELHSDYIEWAKQNIESEPLVSLLKQI